ncbi:MAG: methylenetetrahydrofolate reductase [NAD(P)H] [Bacteroidales bacterium]|nr:methylenetetrahydrofolate reductase [NAD(P)H] [Bacteroidales bacterium]
MKITQIFKTHRQTFSFEFFPPKDEISAVDFGINVGQLMKLNPSFVTVTYGAGGSTQERTFALVDYLQNKIGLTCMAHYTCVNATMERVAQDLKYLEDKGIKNLMLLRGDPPKGQKSFVAPKNGFQYAGELMRFARKSFNFCQAGACYVDKHPEAPSIEDDIRHLKEKVDAGADFLITQLFFENKNYFRFVELARKAGINCRIIPGIIPITAYKQIERFTQMSGAEIPRALKEKLEKYKDDPDATYKAGIEFSIGQCRELLDSGAPGLHFYTLNKSRAAVEIYERLTS